MELSKDIFSQIQELHHPYKWLREGILNINEKPGFSCDNDDVIPMTDFVLKTMEIYFFLKTDLLINRTNKLLNYLADLDKIMEGLQEESKESKKALYSLQVLKYLKKVTKCYIYCYLDDTDKAQKMFLEVKNVKCDGDSDKSTLNAFTGIIYFYFRYKDYDKATEYFKMALTDDSDNALYNFFLGKCLRKNRRARNFNSQAGEEEKACFLKAYNTRNPAFGIFLAQVHRENYENEKSLSIYKNIYYEGKNLKFYHYLRIALGFIQLRDMRRARDCLDKVSRINAEDSIYLHYEGIYYLRMKKLKLSMQYLQRSSDLKNPSAANQLFVLKTQLEKNFDGLEYMMNVLKNFDHLIGVLKQNFLITTAILLLEKSNHGQAFEYFLKALKMDEINSNLLTFKVPTYGYKNFKEFNVYETVNQAIQNFYKSSSFNIKVNELCNELNIILISHLTNSNTL